MKKLGILFPVLLVAHLGLKVANPDLFCFQQTETETENWLTDGERPENHGEVVLASLQEQ